MSQAIDLVVGAAALLAGYAALDWGLRHEALGRLLGWVDDRFSAALASGLALLGSLGALLVPWGLLDISRPITWVASGVSLLLAWNAATRDHDPVVSGPSGAVRLLLCFLALLVPWSPVPLLLTALVLSGRFGFWQHHATFPMRVQLLVSAYVVLRAAAHRLAAFPAFAGVALHVDRASEDAFVTVLTTMMVSHYLITALAKIWLGPRPWSWMLSNRLHYLAASAYSWGWARFVPWSSYRRGVFMLRRVEVPLQIAAFLLELTCPLGLLDHRLAAAYALAFAAFHVGVWLVSGLCFWDWVLTDLLLGALFVTAPPGFGPGALVLGLVVLLLFPLRHKLWKPMPLGWYDSPLTQRVHWYLRGVSGREYRLDNAFMCPHERLYGKVHGCFAVDVEVVTYHLGECFRPEVRDAIVQAGPSLDQLEQVRRHFGIRPSSEELTEAHVRYLKAYFGRLNHGAKKAALPRSLGFLKAPGDQMFYWGDGVRYERQEPVAEVRLVFREEYFDGQELVRLREHEVLHFDVPVAPASVLEGDPSPRELTPRELDEHLLGLAAGRLIRVSGPRGHYLDPDDAVRVT